MFTRKKRVGILGSNNDAFVIGESLARESWTPIFFGPDIDDKITARGFEWVQIDLALRDTLLKAVASRKLDGLISGPLGSISPVLGFLCDQLAIKGPTEKALSFVVDKFKFREALAAKFPNKYPKALLVTSSINFASPDFSDYVIKPRYGSGSKSVVSGERVNIDLLRNSKIELIADPVFEGEEFGVDGFLIDRKLTIFSIRRKINYAEDKYFRWANVVMPTTPTEFSNSIQKELGLVCELAGLDNCFIQADVKWEAQTNSAQIIEIAGRPAGSGTPKLWDLTISPNPVNNFVDSMFSNMSKPNFMRQDGVALSFYSLATSMEEFDSIKNVILKYARVDLGISGILFHNPTRFLSAAPLESLSDISQTGTITLKSQELPRIMDSIRSFVNEIENYELQGRLMSLCSKQAPE